MWSGIWTCGETEHAWCGVDKEVKFIVVRKPKGGGREKRERDRERESLIPLSRIHSQ